MRRVAVALAVLIVAVAGVAAVVAILNARDDSTIGADQAGPGVERAAGARPVVAAGNVVLLFSDERETTALRKLAVDIGGPATPAVQAAGQAVIVRRMPDLRVAVAALTSERRLDANGPDDPRLRPFVEYWLGRRSAG
jgi:hypothetical protein